MRRMKAGLFFTTLFSLACAITLTVNTPQVDLGMLSPDEGSFGAPAGNVLLTVSGKLIATTAEVYTHLQDYAKNDEGYILPAGALAWKIYWASIDTTNWTGINTASSHGFNEWVAYYAGSDDRILSINPGVNTNVDITLGTSLRIPAVQPNGRYRANIVYTVVE